jgi:hypothetical protein
MKTISGSILAVALGLSSFSALAQDPGGPPPRDGAFGPPPRRDDRGPEYPPPPRDAGRPERSFRPEPSLFRILDTNHDGVIDAEEIVSASLVLARLAKQNGGELRVEDFTPRPPRGGMAGPPRPDGRPPFEGPNGDPGPDRFATPQEGPPRRFDGPPRRWRRRWNQPGETPGPRRFGPPRGPDREFDGPRDQTREGLPGERRPDRSGPPPAARPEAGPGPRPEATAQPRPDGPRPPRPDGPGSGSGDNRPPQPPPPAQRPPPFPPGAPPPGN